MNIISSNDNVSELDNLLNNDNTSELNAYIIKRNNELDNILNDDRLSELDITYRLKTIFLIDNVYVKIKRYENILKIIEIKIDKYIIPMNHKINRTPIEIEFIVDKQIEKWLIHQTMFRSYILRDSKLKEYPLKG